MHNFGGWAIQESCFNLIKEILPEGKTILEMGSGYSTKALSQYYKMISIEDQPEWVGSYNSNYIEAPIRNYSKNHINTVGLFETGTTSEAYTPPDLPGEAGASVQKGWYNYEILKGELKGLKYDLILVDGPNGAIGRGGFLKHLNMFNTDIPIIFDDINRIAEKQMMIKVSEILNRPYKELDHKDKSGNPYTGYIL
tara:strand:- start:120 stop:707 length:588 start_codon:yes stop_codon:yes gene_type:complete